MQAQAQTSSTASASKSARAPSPPLSLAVSDGPVSLPIYVAEARGFFRDEGIPVVLQPCHSGRECYRTLTSGACDLATASELIVATGAAARPDVEILATVSASSYQIQIVARRAGLTEAPQIAGKRVGTVMGSSAQYFLDNWLVFNDVDPHSVTVVPQTPSTIVAALEHHDVDAIAIWEPLASSAAAALGGEALTFSSPRVYTQHFNLLASRAVIARREPDLVRVLKALIRAQHVIADEPEAAAAILAARIGVSPAIAVRAMADEDFRIRLDQSLVTTMQSQARWATHAAFDPAIAATSPLDVLRTIEPAPLREAAPDAVGIVQ